MECPVRHGDAVLAVGVGGDDVVGLGEVVGNTGGDVAEQPDEGGKLPVAQEGGLVTFEELAGHGLLAGVYQLEVEVREHRVQKLRQLRLVKVRRF